MTPNSAPIWWNGRLQPPQKISLSPLTYALHYGTSAFEGIRFYETDRGRAVFRLKEHIKRLRHSAKQLGLPLGYKEQALIQATLETVRSSSFSSGYIRPIVFWGDGGLGLDPSSNQVNTVIAVLPWKDYLTKQGIKMKIVSWRRLPANTFDPSCKWGGVYFNSVLAHAEAKKAKANEALLLDQSGHVAEGAGENIFFIQNRNLVTPPEGNILPGITRRSVISLAQDLGYSVEERKIKPERLNKFDECFLTGTAAEVTPVVKIDNQLIGSGQIGPVTEHLFDRFQNLIRGQVGRYRRWLTWVD